MSAPDLVFWISDIIKVYDRMKPEREADLEKYRTFALEFYAYLIGTKQTLTIHQENLDRSRNCHVCGKLKSSTITTTSTSSASSSVTTENNGLETKSLPPPKVVTEIIKQKVVTEPSPEQTLQ